MFTGEINSWITWENLFLCSSISTLLALNCGCDQWWKVVFTSETPAALLLTSCDRAVLTLNNTQALFWELVGWSLVTVHSHWFWTFAFLHTTLPKMPFTWIQWEPCILWNRLAFSCTSEKRFAIVRSWKDILLFTTSCVFLKFALMNLFTC